MTNSKSIAAFALTALAVALAPQAQAQSPAAKPAAAKHAGHARTFASAEDAAKALADAVRAADKKALFAVVGPGSDQWLLSGDAVADRNDWTRFLAAYDEKHGLEAQGEKMILTVGGDSWPFPAPIVKRGSEWAFDSNAGREEVLNRRVGRNELDTVQTLLAVVDAQREYATGDPDGNGLADYARRFVSTKGRKDGLYWPAKAGEPESPLGPLVASAAGEGYGKEAKSGERTPYHGYYYKLVTSQGKSAQGGAYDYIVGGKLLGGFAVVAWPARYGVSGVTTFIVNHDGVVYEKDLGPQTPSIAAHMTRYDPDPTWKKAQ